MGVPFTKYIIISIAKSEKSVVETQKYLDKSVGKLHFYRDIQTTEPEMKISRKTLLIKRLSTLTHDDFSIVFF